MYKKKGLLLLTVAILGGTTCFASSYYGSNWNLVPVSNQQQNAYSAKITDLEKKIKTVPDSQRYVVGMSLVDAYYSEGYVIPANNVWRWLLSLYTDKPAVIENIKNIIYKKLETNPNDEFYNLALGNLYENQGLKADALICYSRVVSINPNNTLANLACARLYQTTGEYQKAIKVYDSILSGLPYESHARPWRAECYLALGMKDKAKAEYENTLAFEPTNDLAIVGLYNTLKDSIPPSEMVVKFLPKYKASTITADAYYEFAKKLSENWEIQGAITYYKLSISLDPKKLDSYVALAECYKQINDMDLYKQTLIVAKPNFDKDFKSIDKINALLVEASENPMADSKEMINTNILGDDVSYYSCINPKTAQTYLKLADIFTKFGNYEEAITDYNKALKLDPKNPEIYYNFASLQNTIAQYINAKNNIKKALAIQPTNIDYLALFDKIQPNATGQLINNALDCINNGDTKKAADIINGLFKEGQQCAMLYFSRGLLRTIMGNDGAALQDLTIARQMDENNPEIIHLMAVIYETKDPKLALKYYQDYVTKAKDPNSNDVISAKTRIDELNKIVPVNNITPAVNTPVQKPPVN